MGDSTRCRTDRYNRAYFHRLLSLIISSQVIYIVFTHAYIISIYYCAVQKLDYRAILGVTIPLRDLMRTSDGRAYAGTADNQSSVHHVLIVLAP